MVFSFKPNTPRGKGIPSYKGEEMHGEIQFEGKILQRFTCFHQSNEVCLNT